MQRVYLSRRNLRTLLMKLDRTAYGDPSYRTIIKQDIGHPKYPCSDVIAVTAVEDAEYYTTGDRGPGRMHPKEEELL